MKKLTKIVATIGPVSDSEGMIEKLIKVGVNIFRFNFKHNTIEWHNERIQRVNKVAEKMGVTVGTLIDLQGPEIRILLPVDQIEITDGEFLYFGEDIFKDTTKKGISISHTEIIPNLMEGQKLLADDGTFIFYVEKKDAKVYLRSKTTGVLKNRKSLNIPGADFPFPVLVDRDFGGLQLASRHEVDFVALSFVRSAQDLKVVREEMKKYNVKGRLIAKIETKKALDHFDSIIEHADGVMVARGDLGVELPMEEVPYYQKIIIRKCIEKGIPVITATQMLQSMVDRPYPTRAEVSDVANAVYDLTDAVMLSAETALGTYPLETVEMMERTAYYNEGKFEEDVRIKYKMHIDSLESTVCDAAYTMYLQLKKIVEIKGFLVYTQTGMTARLLSRYRANIPIFVFTPSKNVSDSLSINFGIHPFVESELRKGEFHKEDLFKAIKLLLDGEKVKKGDKLIVLHGDVWAVEGGTSTVTVITC